MAWNQSVKHLLASSSADTTVRLWDLNEAKCLRTYSHHDAPVENIEWNSEMASVLLTGAHDKSCAVFDTRAADAVARWGFDSDVECTSWHPHATSCFLAGSVLQLAHLCLPLALGILVEEELFERRRMLSN